MRTIAEIQNDLEELRKASWELDKQRDKLLAELKEAQKQELKDFAHQYIKFGYDNTVMLVLEQEYRNGFVVLKGPKIADTTTRNFYNKYHDHFRVSARYVEIEYAVENFKEETSGVNPRIYTVDQDTAWKEIKSYTDDLTAIMLLSHWLE